eukprot:CAMPEP_0203885476 /NCGR_PEP_ID=MMETSP0359-20131031/29409_1 /ASSEMBLY_ACC=CAM_ASM_000338 /TAXON_ID=268821 /ORGANISM="Scrippsiella Hangoei, Strain SHTV-5" /LENGTH=42 /DNA_ID= /DNA_START= /DNA_END= /DNA_ORIENTATION=
MNDLVAEYDQYQDATSYEEAEIPPPLLPGYPLIHKLAIAIAK